MISPRGRLAFVAVAILRLATALATLVALVGLGRAIDGEERSAVTVVVAGIAAASTFAYAEVAAGGRAARAEERRIRSRILTHQFAVHGDPAVPAAEFPPSRMIEMMTAGAEKATEFRQVYLGPTLASLLVPLLTLGYIGVAIDPVVGFVTLALIPLVPLVIGIFLLAVRRSADFSQSSRGIVTARYMDVIRNLITIRLYNAGERIGLELRTQAERNRATLMAMLARNQTMIMILDAMFSLVFLLAAAVLVVWRGDHLTVGQGVTVVFLAVLLLEPLQQVAGFFFVGIGGIRGQKEMREFYAAMPALTKVSADPAAVPREAPARGGIELSGVGFDYGRGPVLAGVDLHVRPGEKIAVVGASGTGKTTLLNIIQGALPAHEGTVRVGGVERSPAEGQEQCATVAQSTWMFTGTIAENLRLAAPKASEEQMWRALRLAHVARDVEQMPGGLHTHLGEGSALISGGQAQRISLARALLSGRRILLLDEPTSQVDIDSESQIVGAIRELPREWTVVIVTHRASMLRAVDRVYELQAGGLREATGREELLDA